ncbi:MAG TPA: glycosyltransferase family 39 protein [Streptosporangiaceae bacterium]
MTTNTTEPHAAAGTGGPGPGAGQSRWPDLAPRSAAVLAMAGAVVVALIACASRYGYHRDELYFLAAGRHLAWAYPDQGVFTPLVARAMSAIAPGSLTVLRMPAALAAGGTVLVTGRLCRELGGRARAQALAAACAAVAVMVLFTGHTLSTSTFDLLAWTGASWLVVRAVRSGQDRLWLAAGAVLGAGLLNKPLPAFLAAAMVAGVAVCGPRRLLTSRPVWLAGAIALALWTPWLAWQAAHGWPQLAVSRSIAAGASASSAPWWQIIPFQALLAGPVLAPVWIAGIVRLFRDPAVRQLRFLAWAWVLLAVVFMITGGKPYYLAGLLPVLIAAGAVPADQWLNRGRRRARRTLLGAAVAVSAMAGAVIALPVLPARDAGPVIAMNPDVGETIGWPSLVADVAAARQRLPRTARVVVLTENYGEAGAIDRYGPAYGLPAAYSGHNAFGLWGPPPPGSTAVITIGFGPGQLAEHLRDCTAAGRVSNTDGISNEERGQPVDICRGPRGSWARQWPALRHLG